MSKIERNRTPLKSASFKARVGIILLVGAMLVITVRRADFSEILARTVSSEIARDSLDLVLSFAMMACIYFFIRLFLLEFAIVRLSKLDQRTEDQTMRRFDGIVAEGLVFSLVFSVVLMWLLGGVYIALLLPVSAVLAYKLLLPWWRSTLRGHDQTATASDRSEANMEQTTRLVEQQLVKKYRKWLAVLGLGSLTAIAGALWSLYGLSTDAAITAAKAAAEDAEQAMELRFSQSAGIIGQLHTTTVDSLTQQLTALGGVRRDLERVSSLLPILTKIELETARKNAELLSANQDTLTALVNVEALDPRVEALEDSNFARSSELANYVKKSDLPDFTEFAIGEHPDVSKFITREDLPNTSGFALKTDIVGFVSIDDIPDVSAFASVSDVQFIQLGTAYRDYYPTGSLATGVGTRLDQIQIEFAEPFVKRPNVSVSLSEVEASSNSSVRIKIAARNVTESGFTCEATVSNDAIVHKVGCSWVAVGLRHSK